MTDDYLRGHPIYWDAACREWRFSDTGEPTAETWFNRPCGHCGLYGNSSDGEADPCLGVLPGVTNACCGHGNPREAYICFQGGLALRGFEIDRLHQRRMSDSEQESIAQYNKSIRRYREAPEPDRRRKSEAETLSRPAATWRLIAIIVGAWIILSFGLMALVKLLGG